MNQQDTPAIPELANFRAILDHLEGRELDYVWERAQTTTDADAYRNAGISKPAFYRWDADRRDYLNELAQQLRRERRVAAERVLIESVVEAAQVLVDAMKCDKWHIKVRAAGEVLDRMLGKPAQAIDIGTREGGGIQVTMTFDDGGELHDRYAREEG